MGRGFESHPILDGNGFKAMPGLIAVSIMVKLSYENKETTGGQMGHTKKYLVCRNLP